MRLLLLPVLLLVALPALAQWDATRPDALAPLGVHDAHLPAPYRTTLTYRYTEATLGALFDGTDEVTPAEVFADDGSYRFLRTPTRQAVTAHTFELTVAPLEVFAFRFRLPLLRKTTDYESRFAQRFRTSTAGMGDAALLVQVRLTYLWNQHLTATFGVQLPAGTTRAHAVTPFDSDSLRLPYPAQLGTGSYSVLAALTYQLQTARTTWGGQVRAHAPLNTNRDQYRHGNRVEASLWGNRRLFSWLSLSIRAAGAAWGNLSGSDRVLAGALDFRLSPAVDPRRQGGYRVMGALGVTLAWKAWRLQGMAQHTFWQHLEGPQLGETGRFSIGGKYHF